MTICVCFKFVNNKSFNINTYAYFNSKTLEKVFGETYLSTIEHDVTTSKNRFYHFWLVNVYLNIFIVRFFNGCTSNKSTDEKALFKP